MGNKLLRFQRVTLVLGAATVTLLCIPYPTHGAIFGPTRPAGCPKRCRWAKSRCRPQRRGASFDRFLDGHREIAEQIRKDPSLSDNRHFVQDHPALQAYLQDNPGVRDQLRQDPNAFMQQDRGRDRVRDRDPMHDHMSDFGGFLENHSDIQKDLSRNPSVVKDHEYVQNHAELDAYLNAHPDVRTELMANPQDFVHGAQQYNNGSASSGT